MKKRILLSVMLIVSCFIISACGSPDPIKAHIGEMDFQMEADLTQVTDEKEAMQIMIDNGAYDSKSHFKEVSMDLLYFEGDTFNISINTVLAPYKNNQLDQCIKDVFKKDPHKNTYLKDIKIDGYKGKVGFSEKEENCKTYNIFVLKDGIFYDFESTIPNGSGRTSVFKLLDIIDPPIDGEEFMQNIVDSIKFVPNSLGEFKVKNGNMTYNLPENYQSLSLEDDKRIKEQKGHALFGDYRIEICSFRFNRNDVGNADAQSFKEYLGNATLTTEKINGKQFDVVSRKEDGYYVYTAFVNDKNSHYLIELDAKKKSRKILDSVLKTVSFK